MSIMSLYLVPKVLATSEVEKKDFGQVMAIAKVNFATYRPPELATFRHAWLLLSGQSTAWRTRRCWGDGD